MERRRIFGALALTASLLLPELAARAQDDCLEGTLWEPYSEVCADVRDVREQFMPSQAHQALGQSELADLPVPGGMAAGTIYLELPALESGRLHTKMFVQPDGLQQDADLPLFYTTATSRVHHGLEVIGLYWREYVGFGRLGLWAWPCLPDYPCPNGRTSPGWQFFTAFANVPCNITHDVDQGGHAQKVLYYANHTDKLDNGAPPQWKSAMYLWNYCDAAWDLAWEHTYREDKVDCSLENSRCGWWGPSLETFGEDPYPQIAELGYEDSLLYHNGKWSELRWPEAGFRDPADFAKHTPWQLFHLDPNRGYGIGNWIDTNDPPIIEDQQALEIFEDEDLTISPDALVIADPDVDPRFHTAYEITLYGGDDYTHSDLEVTPDSNYAGTLRVPVTASDGAADSPTFELQISVVPVNDPPVVTGQNPLATRERTAITITAQDIAIDDPDNEPADMTISVRDGAGYQRVDNTITPELGVVGDLPVGVVISDGDLESEPFTLLVVVSSDVTPPELSLLGAASVALTVGAAYNDAGATAVDDLDGDITDRITTDNPVNTSQAGVYTVVYSVADLAGNSASATRTVTVNAVVTKKKHRGGGGSFGVPILLLLLGFAVRRRKLPARLGTVLKNDKAAKRSRLSH